MTDTTIKMCGTTLSNPVIPASGTFGFGYEFADFYDINILGSISIKGTTRSPRFGNPTPRIAECCNGLINSIGLQNPGIDKVISDELPKLYKCYNKKIIANISAFSIEEYVECCQKIDSEERVLLIELNVSCPNVHGGGISFGTDKDILREVVCAVRKVTRKPLYIKLTPNVTNIVEMAKTCEDAGADGICLINTLFGMRIDLKTKKPIIANKMGGFSGRAIFPVAERMIYQVYDAVKIPIIGAGGVASARDVIEMMLAGATAVEIGAENLINPYACKDIIEELPSVMEEYNIENLSDIIGMAHDK